MVADLLIALLLVQARGCAAAGGPCADRTETADVAAYVSAYETARAAFRDGGPEPLLAPVLATAARLQAADRGTHGPLEIASHVLQAAAAAAQSEHDVLALYLDHALAQERARLTAGLSGAPSITAHEAAGELYLQLYRYDAAEQAFLTARSLLGDTPRIAAGLAAIAEQRRRP